jgi:hypothetical protein
MMTTTRIAVSHLKFRSKLTELIGIESKPNGKFYSSLKPFAYRTILPYLFVLSVCLFSLFSSALLGVQSITDMCVDYILYKVGRVRNYNKFVDVVCYIRTYQHFLRKSNKTTDQNRTPYFTAQLI